jgi:hypothetical protein
MTKIFTVEIALDSKKHNYQTNKQFLLTRLPTIGCEDWYSYHDIERRPRKIIYKEIFCIRICNVDTVIQLISLVKRVTGIYIECIYNKHLIYASNHYSKLMNKDKVKELKQRIKTMDEKRIINCITKE